jgi:hypothetical protein
MLEVQKYLRSGKTLDDLNAELGIKVTTHDELPLIILNYDQIESPKSHPIVRECRALVLERDSWDLVAKSMHRFFNWGEMADEMDSFDFSDFRVGEKHDGSLCLVYNYRGQWMANTRGSFGFGLMECGNKTWQEGFQEALGVPYLQALDGYLDARYTYVAEFVSPYNKVVRRYEKPAMHLITMFEGLRELSPQEIKGSHYRAFEKFKDTPLFPLYSIDEIKAWLDKKAEEDATFEGVVIRDKDNRRWKLKSSAYLALHALKGESGNIFHPRHLLPFILGGEDSELLTYFPEVKEKYYECKSMVLDGYSKMLEVWADAKDVEAQKDFALSIVGKTPFTALLFNVRKKYGKEQRSENMRHEWRQSEDLILRHVFEK